MKVEEGGTVGTEKGISRCEDKRGNARGIWSKYAIKLYSSLVP